jgi:hypothetical protein
MSSCGEFARRTCSFGAFLSYSGVDPVRWSVSTVTSTYDSDSLSCRVRGQGERLWHRGSRLGARRPAPVAGRRPLHGAAPVPPRDGPAPRAQAEAERVLTRLLNQVDERRNRRTRRLTTRCSTVPGDRRHRATRSGTPTRASSGAMSDRSSAGSRSVGSTPRCSTASKASSGAAGRVSQRSQVGQPQQAEEHECDERCRPHVYRLLSASRVREFYWILLRLRP